MQPSTLSNQEIISSLRQSYDPILLGELLQRHRPQVIGQCYRYTRDWEVALDLSQEVFLCVLTKFQGFRAQSSFTTWLYAITYHCSIDYLRHTRVNYSFQEEAYWPTNSTTNADCETFDPKERWALLDKIEADKQQLLLMKYQDYLSVREIHQITSLSECAIKTRLCRARKRLRKLLAASV